MTARPRKKRKSVSKQNFECAIARYGLRNPFEQGVINSEKDEWKWKLEIMQRLPRKEANELIVSYMLLSLMQDIEKLANKP